MDCPGHHELISQVWIQIPSITDDDTHKESQCGLRKCLHRSRTDAAPPLIKLIPYRPPGMGAPRLKKLHPFGSGHGSDRINSLTLKIDCIVESARIQRSAW